MKIASAATPTIIRAWSAHLPDENFGGGGNLFILAMPRSPCWIVRVPKDIIWGHMGIWSDNPIAMFGALYRLHFPLTSEGKVAPSAPVRVPHEPDVQQLNQDKPR